MKIKVRDASTDEFDALGQLMVRAYSSLDGFPTKNEQPSYYDLLANVGRFAGRPHIRVLVAESPMRVLVGGVVYFAHMAEYGSGGIATSLTDAAGFRLLAVDPAYQRMGVGMELSKACISLAREHSRARIVLHTTRPMRVAWSMYEALGFRRCAELDFLQGDLEVFGFQLSLTG